MDDYEARAWAEYLLTSCKYAGALAPKCTTSWSRTPPAANPRTLCLCHTTVEGVYELTPHASGETTKTCLAGSACYPPVKANIIFLPGEPLALDAGAIEAGLNAAADSGPPAIDPILPEEVPTDTGPPTVSPDAPPEASLPGPTPVSEGGPAAENSGAVLYHGTDMASAQNIVQNGISRTAAAQRGGGDVFWATQRPSDAQWFADSAPGTTPGNPGTVVTIRLPHSLSVLEEAGHIMPGELPGSWQVINWEAFNDLASYFLGAY